MSRRQCDHHEFREHGIGAGLTRKICVRCGVVHIGATEFRFSYSDPWMPLDEEIDLTSQDAVAVH